MGNISFAALNIQDSGVCLMDITFLISDDLRLIVDERRKKKTETKLIYCISRSPFIKFVLMGEF